MKNIWSIVRDKEENVYKFKLIYINSNDKIQLHGNWK